MTDTRDTLAWVVITISVAIFTVPPAIVGSVVGGLLGGWCGGALGSLLGAIAGLVQWYRVAS